MQLHRTVPVRQPLIREPRSHPAMLSVSHGAVAAQVALQYFGVMGPKQRRLAVRDSMRATAERNQALEVEEG